MKRIVKKTFFILGSFLFLLFAGYFLVNYSIQKSPYDSELECNARGGSWDAYGGGCSCRFNTVPSSGFCIPYLQWRLVEAQGIAYGKCFKSGRQDVEEENEYLLQLRPLNIIKDETLPENLLYRPERPPVICGKGQPDTAVIIVDARVINDNDVYPIYISTHDPALSVVRVPVVYLVGRLREFRPENTEEIGKVEVPLEKFIEFFQEPENLIPGTMLE